MSRTSWASIEVLLDLALDAPRDRQQPVEVVAHHRRLGRHRAHLLELLQLGQGLVARFLRELGVLDLLLELLDVVALVAVAEFLLNGLHLLIQIVLALRLLHLALDARADLLLDLQDGDLALHQRVDALEPLGERGDLEHFLLVGDLDGQVRGDRVGELGVVLDLADGAEHLGRDLLVELDVALELGDRRARQRLDLVLGADRLGDALDLRLEVVGVVDVAHHLGARGALDQHLHGAVGQLQELQHGGQRAHLVDGVGRRIVVAGILLRGEQDLLVGAHHFFERVDRLLAADEQRHDHVRKDDDVAQRQDRIGLFAALFLALLWFAHVSLVLRAISGLTARALIWPSGPDSYTPPSVAAAQHPTQSRLG